MSLCRLALRLLARPGGAAGCRHRALTVSGGPSCRYIDKLEDIVKFLMKCNRLTVEHLAIIWDSQKDKFEVIVKNIHDLLAKLAWQFEGNHLDHLFACFKQSWGGTNKEMMGLIGFVRRLAEVRALLLAPLCRLA